MNPIRISAVSYLNTLPFVYGIRTWEALGPVDLRLDIPSVCAENLRTGKVDIALVPVGAIPELQDCRVVTGFCIGAEKAVETVLMLSRVQLDQIRSVTLDPDSRTSVKLVKILARNHWHIDPEWITAHPDEGGVIPGNPESIVAIGDKTFGLKASYRYRFDLAEEWIQYSGLPFVFAVWMTRGGVGNEFLSRFNDALAFGVSNKEIVPEFFKEKIPPGVDAGYYLKENISFELTARKREGMARFLDLIF